VKVTVTPTEFSLVHYDAARIAALFEDVAGKLGLDGGITVVVDENSPFASAKLTSLDPVVIEAESGAFEDPKAPRCMSDAAVATTAARLLARARDRRDPAFVTGGPPPPEAELTLAQADAWDAYAMGRASRMGIDVFTPRWRYRFRNRHGFTDLADRVFDRLWSAGSLRWADLAAACADTGANERSVRRAARPAHG